MADWIRQDPAGCGPTHGWCSQFLAVVPTNKYNCIVFNVLILDLLHFLPRRRERDKRDNERERECVRASVRDTEINGKG